MAAVTLWAWDDTNKVWVKVKVDADGVLEVAMAVTNLDDLADVYVPSPTDGYILYWDEAATKWKCEAIPAAAWADITGKPASPSLEELATEHEADGTHGAITPTSCTLLTTHIAVKDAHFSNIITITFIIDGGGSAITTGQKGHLEIPFACTLTGWTLAADAGGAIVIDVWKDTYANFPPTNADAMPGAGKEPTIAATNQKAQDTDISDWTTVAIAAGDILAFNVDSITTITRVTLSLKATKS